MIFNPNYISIQGILSDYFFLLCISTLVIILANLLVYFPEYSPEYTHCVEISLSKFYDIAPN